MSSPGNSQSKSFGDSYRSRHGFRTVAEESIAKDLDEYGEEQANEEVENGLSPTVSHDSQAHLGPHNMAGVYRRPSYIAGGLRPFFNAQGLETGIPMEKDREAALEDERSLLRDNSLIAPKHLRRSSEASNMSGNGLARRISMPGFRIPRRKSHMVEDENALRESPNIVEPSETTTLLAHSSGPDPSAPYDGDYDPETIDKKWEEAVMAGKIHTTWQRESMVLARYSAPLILTFILQNSLTLTSVFTVGHIGKIELGAVSLGSMTANITGYAVFHGLATSLDTLCAQAYGSGRKKLVGLQLQRMVFFLWTITIPIAVIWLFGTQILAVVVPEKETARLAGQYLKILIFGAPGYACFESSKRFVQAQGRFAATLYVLLICAPLNVLLHWLFVWKFQWGFIGCPIAVVITENLMPFLLFLYVRFVGGMECWPGFTWKAFHNWGPMIRLALPGLIMVLAEFLAFEILTLSASWISSTHLAAQTVLQSLSILTYQVPFPISIAASTRVANLIGAGLPEAAKTTARVTIIAGAIAGSLNMILLSSTRFYIPWLFTNDADVVALTARTLPINAAFQLFDALAANCNGLLRGLGKQEFGGYVNLFAYYAIAMPISFGTGFGLHWDLFGLWAGPAVALGFVSGIEGIYIYKTSWQKASEEAAARNAAG